MEENKYVTNRTDHSMVEDELTREERRAIIPKKMNTIIGKNGKQYKVPPELISNKNYMNQLNHGGNKNSKERSKNKSARRSRKNKKR